MLFKIYHLNPQLTKNNIIIIKDKKKRIETSKYFSYKLKKDILSSGERKN